MNKIVESTHTDLEPDDIVQIDPSYAPEQFGGMFLVVKEIKYTGVYGYVIEWGVRTTGPIWVRVPFDRIEPTGGRVKWDLSQEP